MDWETIKTTVIVSLLSSSFITSVIIYVVKKSFDKGIDLKFEQILEKSKLELREEARRKTDLFNKQAEIFQQMLALVYRMRNITRDLASLELSNQKFNDHLRNLQKYSDELSELIYKDRAILPESVFKVVHDAKHVSQGLFTTYDYYQHSRRNKETRENPDQKLHIEQLTRDLDEVYSLLVDLIQPRLGIVSDR